MDNIGGLFSRLTLLPKSIIHLVNSDVDITDSEILTNPLFANNPDLLSDSISFSLNTEDMFIDDIPQYISLDFGKTINDKDDPTDIRKKLGNILGFQNKVYKKSITLEKPSASIHGDGPLNLNYVQYGYLIIDDFQTNGEVNIYGNDYETHDGTGIRDYIHVVDLAKAHVATIEKQHVLYPFEVINIGSGEGTSVLELVKAFELASGIKINLIISDRRDGDLAETWTNPDFAFNKIGWKAKLNINDMCRDSWAWQKNNPKGYT